MSALRRQRGRDEWPTRWVSYLGVPASNERGLLQGNEPHEADGIALCERVRAFLEGGVFRP